MSASNDDATAARLNSVISVLGLVLNMTGMIVGIIGGICNIITFTAPQLRTNATVFYLLCATVFSSPLLRHPNSDSHGAGQLRQHFGARIDRFLQVSLLFGSRLAPIGHLLHVIGNG